MNDHIWSSDRYWNKAVWYFERACQSEDGDHATVLFYALALEFLARAALTKIHPVLNADPQGDGAHLLYAFGIGSPKQPKSIPAHAVFGRLERANADFKPHKAFCEYMSVMRNSELHSGELPFAGLRESEWLAEYYAACVALCNIANKPLEALVGEEADHAVSLVEARSSEQEGEVKKRIAAHRTTFEAKPEGERLSAQRRALTSTRGRYFARADCPACGSSAVRTGDPIRSSPPRYEDGVLYVELTYAVTGLRCDACELRLRTVTECHFAKVDPRYVVRETTDLHEVHEDEEYMEYDNM